MRRLLSADRRAAQANEEIKEIMREAIFQEPDVSRIDSMTVSYDGRSVSVAFTATLVNKETITLEVTA